MKNLGLMILALVLVTALAPVIFVINLVRLPILGKSLSEYYLQIAIGIDQVGGSILYGTEDWTVSSYTHILAQKGIRSAIYFEKLIDLLFGKNHCKISYECESKTIIH